MATREKSVKIYVVRLSAEERERLEVLIRKGKSPARRLLKAGFVESRCFAGGEGWSDSQIIDALDTAFGWSTGCASNGWKRALRRCDASNARRRRSPIFDGEKEALIWRFQTAKGRVRWTLRLLENKVVELNIVDRASDSTIGRVLKKHSQAPSPRTMGHPPKPTARSWPHGGRAGRLHAATRS